MKVRATRRGFIHSRLQNIGDEFEVPDGAKFASWWERVEDEPVVSKAPAAEPVPVEDKPAPVKKKAKKRAKKKS